MSQFNCRKYTLPTVGDILHCMDLFIGNINLALRLKSRARKLHFFYDVKWWDEQVVGLMVYHLT